ncbi:phosphate signaling complex protein PhoU [Alkalihalobacillus sp. BA299]|uniref:phosphate signaling complex protein PhoU n=1 Tax=Alkalihalobacillus sp. BA299 TaxID=2815938 RepID=UPI001ADB6807|nr:phosphate signaling complex protein PhoU [Alkalihalobacillus sp. BA299]
MAIRANFDTELKELKDLLLKMGKLAEDALNKSIIALKEQNTDLALEVIDKDYKINQLEEEINDKGILMIAKQSPVASDLRRIIVALKISNDVERIADYAVNIAKSTIRVGDKPFIKPLVDIPEMARLTQGMLSSSLQAYYKEDITLATDLAEIDDQVDKMYGKTVQELLILMSKNPDSIGQITQLAFVCRYLERTADHCTNISEHIIYLIKGKRYDLND